MNCYLISYDLGVPETSEEYKKVINYIKGYKTWAKPLYSLFFIKTNKTVATVRDELQKLTDSNDKILVINVTGEGWATARIDARITDWMKENI